MTNTTSQDLIHRRLKAVMDRPENQSCCDCGDHKPTWASIIVPPASVPAEESPQPMGALCCFHCSGAHRRLGVHICFVRSVTLDDWKEKEVIAIELGGNRRVNRAFEARLSSRRAALEKPNSKSDLEMRDRFVKAKYRDHKYFDPTKYSTEKPPTPMKKEPDIDPTLFHGMETVNLFSPTQMSKYVDATRTTTNHNIPNIHTDDDKSDPVDDEETMLKRQSSMENGSSVRLADCVERKEDCTSVSPKSNHEPEKPVYFLPLKDTGIEAAEEPVVSQGKGQSNHSRPRTSREREERASSRSRTRRSSRSHDSSCEESAEKNKGRRSLRQSSSSKSPKRSISQSRRAQLKQSRSRRHIESSQSQEKERSKATSSMERSTSGSAEVTDISAPMRRNLSGPSVAKVVLSSDTQNGSATLIRKSSSLLSLSTSSKGSNLALSGKEHKDVSSLRNATFSLIPATASSNKLDAVTSTFDQAQRLASEYILQELAKIQVPRQGNVPRQSSQNQPSNDVSKPASNRRASVSKSPPRSSVSGRRPKARHSSSPEMDPKKEETSTSGRRSVRHMDESNKAEESSRPSSYVSILNDESGDEYDSTNKGGEETSEEIPHEIGGVATIRVASKYALAEMDDMQNSFQQDDKPIRRSARRMPTSSRSTNRGSGSTTQRHQSRSRSRGSTASRSPSSSPSEDRHDLRHSVSISPSTDLESRHSTSKSPTRQTGNDEESNEFLAPLVRNPGKNLERAHSHGSSSRRMIRQASSRDVPGEQKTVNSTTNISQVGSRPSSRRTMADDPNQSEEVEDHASEYQRRGSLGGTNRALRANRQRRDPLSSKSDHQARSRGRMASRVEAANQKAAFEPSSLTQSMPALPNRALLARVASMSFLEELGGNIPGASSPSQDVATTAADVAVPGPSSRRVDDKNSLSAASSHGSRPRSSRAIDRNGLGSASSHGINPRMVRGKTTGTKASSGNDRVLQLFAAGPPKDENSTSVNNDDEEALESNNNSSEGPERPTKALSAAAMKAMKELKEIIG